MKQFFSKHSTKIITFFICSTIILSVITGVILYKSDEKVLNHNLTTPISINGTYFTDEDKTVKKLPKDYYLDLSGHQTVTINGQFNKPIEKNQMLLMRIDNLKVKIYLNDKLIYDIDDLHSHGYIRSPGNGWFEYISPDIKTTDKITFVLSNVYTNHVNTAFDSFLSNLKAGYSKDLIVTSLNKNIPNMFISIMIIGMGIFVGIYAFSIRKIKDSFKTTITFAGLAIASGLWFFVVFDTHAFLIPYHSLNNTIDFTNMLFVAAFLFFNIASIIKNKGRIALAISGVIILLIIMFLLLVQLFTTYDVYDFALLVEFISIVMCLEILPILIYEFVKNRSKNILLVVIAYSFICLGIIADVICNYFELLPVIFWFKIGFFAFLIVQFLLILQSVKELFFTKATISILKKERDSLKRVAEYQSLITEATHGIYESVHEINITQNKVNSKETEEYFESLGVPKNTPYHKALNYIAEKQIKKEFRQDYIDIFSPKNILKAFEEGKKGLQYEFMISNDDKNYHWIRIAARIFFWDNDNSVHIIVYRKNIDEEKKKEIILKQQASKDLLTNLNNKVSTENAIKNTLANANNKKYAFFIIDIDDFKDVNDSFGHAAGDIILVEFAEVLKKQFRNNDIVGRIGGDEFVAFMEIANNENVKQKGQILVDMLNRDVEIDGEICHISPSIGISISPEDGTEFELLYKNADRALYHTKHKGKNGYTIYKNKK